MGESVMDCNTPDLTGAQSTYGNGGLESDCRAEAPYVVSQDHIHKKRPMRIICIGAGIAGIAAAYKYQRRLSEITFTIYEKNYDVGGTWLENRYPGCACDIPAHGYTYSWEGNPEWSRFYAEAPEIHAYFKGCAIKWDCMKYIKLGHRVIRAEWSSSDSVWDITTEILETGALMHDRCDVLLSATGVLNNWKWPAIDGLNDFKGKLLHSARWDDSYDFKDKNVAVIGAGSSAIQIVPNLTPKVRRMINFIRSPTWITPEFSQSLAMEGRDTKFSSEQIQRFKDDKKYFLQYRKLVQNTGSSNFGTFYKGSPRQLEAVKNFSAMMRKRLNEDEEIAARLIPKFPVGCRRYTPGSGYLEALVASKSQVIMDEIDHIDSGGLVTKDGNYHAVDAIICATGFDTSFRPAFPVIGVDGRNLSKYWSDEPLHYLSIAVPKFPNYFIIGGPNSPIANGSLISGLEVELDYAYSCVEKMQTENITSMDVKEEAMRDFIEHRNESMKAFVWSGDCRSWYKNGRIDGPVIGPWPGSSWHFNEALEKPRFEDYNLTYMQRNRFSYLGYGRTLREELGESTAEHLTEEGVVDP
ncbi:uncharacterized protein Z519_01333 [Cladophialophora bantiana CBS 173.52]|uniref:L-ornithine N(5)-oxygenase n=1 Tax=Cladophialophora bantiana (strain ATCC 10958 / CBS 173.52 / CDC B-1940 / NIH 8579) TaxID=1442370 RepID=A0A0D2ILS3_CLAB1|nr:uncharacterized protein Z519_01333 [Cladophialophora bantiana CBS 173.52]KIW97749.1 hypothetical protein Z519_01333 [Cladophialophora bantiana CBS 173.52]